PAALASRRPLPRGEDHQFSLLAGDGLAPGLVARALLDQQELAALVVDATAAEEGGDRQREGDVAVEVLVETVVAAGLVVEQERRGFRLAGAPADGQQAGEIVGIAAARSERFLPAVGGQGKRRIRVCSLVCAAGWERVRGVPGV